MTNDPDISKIDRIIAGDRQAYAELVDKHKGYAYTIAYRSYRTDQKPKKLHKILLLKRSITLQASTDNRNFRRGYTVLYSIQRLPIKERAGINLKALTNQAG